MFAQLNGINGRSGHSPCLHSLHCSHFILRSWVPFMSHLGDILILLQHEYLNVCHMPSLPKMRLTG